MPVRVLLADDHRLMREGTAALLGADERIEVVGLAHDGREALALAERRKPDVVLLDLNMPEVDGLEACARLREGDGGPEVLMLTVSEEEPDLYAALRVGAAGYLTKDVPPAELIEAVLAVARGEPRIAPAMASRMLADMGRGEAPPEDPLARLSDRERERLRTVRRQAHDLDGRVALEQRGRALAHQAVVVGDQHAYRSIVGLVHG